LKQPLTIRKNIGRPQIVQGLYGKVYKQDRKRLIKGEVIAHEEKVFSIFQEDTE